MNRRLENQPKYKIGQMVTLEVTFKSGKLDVSDFVTGRISTISATGTHESDSYDYGVTNDMPGCYHIGESPFKTVSETFLNKLNLCDTCAYRIPDCHGEPEFGKGKGNDNIIGCNKFVKAK